MLGNLVLPSQFDAAGRICLRPRHWGMYTILLFVIRKSEVAKLSVRDSWYISQFAVIGQGTTRDSTVFFLTQDQILKGFSASGLLEKKKCW